MTVGAEIEGIDAGLMKIVDGFAAQELAADFVMRAGFFFDEHDAAAGGGKAQSEHGAGGTAADDEMIDVSVGIRVRSSRLSPADAKARGHEWLDGDSLCVEAGRGAHSSPIFGDESARDGDRAIVLDEGMKSSELREDAKADDRERRRAKDR